MTTLWYGLFCPIIHRKRPQIQKDKCLAVTCNLWWMFKDRSKIWQGMENINLLLEDMGLRPQEKAINSEISCPDMRKGVDTVRVNFDGLRNLFA